MAYNSFPYVSMHELNLDYLLNKSKEVQANVEASAGSASAAASSAAAAANSAEASLTYSRNSANSAAASEASAADSAESARIAVAAAGDPVTFTAASQLTNTSKIYVYIGETGTYTYGHWYYYAGGAWIDGGVYGMFTTDTTLDPTSTNAIANKAVYEAMEVTDQQISAIDNVVMSEAEFHVANALETRWTIVSTNTWSAGSASSAARGCVISVPSTAKQVDLVFGAEGGVIAFLRTGTLGPGGSTPDFSTSYPGRILFNTARAVSYLIPDDCHYLYFLSKNSAGNSLAPTSIRFLSPGYAAQAAYVPVSGAPVFHSPAYVHNRLFLHEYYNDGTLELNNTQGIGSDGSNLYYALRTFDSGNISGLSYMRKVNAATGNIILADTAPSVNLGHVEDICFVPAYVPGFDNGSSDRLYICDFDRSPDHQTGRYVHVISADDFSYITGFDTASLLPSIDGWAGISGISYNAAHDQFVLKAKLEGDTDHPEALVITSNTGTLVRGIKYKKNGTGAGLDCDDNFIYLVRYITGSGANVFNIRVNIFDWNLTPVNEATIEQAFWEIEGLCNAGGRFYATWNELADIRTGIDITVSSGIRMETFNTVNDYPGWNGGLYNILTI